MEGVKGGGRSFQSLRLAGWDSAVQGLQGQPKRIRCRIVNDYSDAGLQEKKRLRDAVEVASPKFYPWDPLRQHRSM
ncbi:hypothetical protein H6P81_003775 [Aristolochia fimbriata]|uniref:Uncharacterized protein n=1 Tax=Aristolochia fimbriata TaxID=158543 RepID=A0AAV7FGN2_ARIFI|nr:hypothetical protein H6P81_003775 [Aristolochia fimbriata]